MGNSEQHGGQGGHAEDRALRRARKDAKVADTAHSVERRLEDATLSSKALSAVWDEPSAELLRFREGMDLTSIAPASTPGFPGRKAEGKRFIDISAGEIMRFQHLLYANGSRGSRRRILLILQGMDASGKGGIVQHVFSQVNPMGIHYHGFGAPTAEERQHDFLFRIRRELPKPGWMAVFDRSQYEDIVMPRIYGTYPETLWRSRYRTINDFEGRLADDGCTILKVFLVTSKDAQKRRFLKRLDDPSKHWKFDESDLDARARWDDYMQAWQEVFERTSTPSAPWYLIPADKRWYSRAVVSELLRTTMQDMDMRWPEANMDMDAARRRLEHE